MRGRGLVRASALVVLAGLGVLGSAAAASAGQFTVVTCQGDNARFSVDAFSRVATSDMKIVNSCSPGPAPRGLITRNKIRAGKKVPYGAYAAVVLHPPPGTVFTHLKWSGHGQRAECRFALQMYAEGARMQPPIQAITQRTARSTCPRPPRDTRRRPQDADLDSVDWSLRDFDFAGGATQIVQRTICLSKQGCAVSRANYVRTEVANLTVQDEAPPTVSIVPDTALARGEWVRGNQPLNYVADDNVAVKRAIALVDAVEREDDENRSCPAAVAPGTYDQLIPCPNGPGTITVKTQRLPEGTRPLAVRAQDAGDMVGESVTLQARIDNTPPGRVDVGVDGGPDWRNRNDFAAIWSNPPEGDRAPIVAAMYKLCPTKGGACSSSEHLGEGIARLPVTVPAGGEWTLSVWRRDAAGNAEPGYASVPVTLQFDPDPPQLAFEPPPAADPTR